MSKQQELEDWSEETGLPLPMHVREIVRLEDEGHIVDLETGDVFDNPDDGDTPCDEDLIELWL